MELEKSRAEVAAAREALAQSEAQFVERCRQWEAQQSAVPAVTSCPGEPESVSAPAFRELADEPPVDVQAVLRRWGKPPAIEEQEPAEPIAEPDLPPAAAATVIDRGEQPEESEDEHDQAIAQYVAALLGRSRQGPAAATRPDPAPQAIPETASCLPTEDNAAHGTNFLGSRPLLPLPKAPRSISPGAVAPEKQVDLSSMRELANLSAQNALGQHARRQLKAAARTKLALATAALTIGVVLLGMWHGLGMAAYVFYAGLASFLVALFWTIQYAILAGKLIVSRTGHLTIAPATEKTALTTEAAADGAVSLASAPIASTPLASAATGEYPPAADE
jgi:hypothetical protein